MKKLFKYFFALCSAAAVIVGCQNEELDTAQYSDTEVVLVSFGPNPVMRGGAITFIGSNLQKVTEVQVPGIDPITEITVITEGVQSEIRVVLPNEGPEVGPITLIAGDKTIVTKSDITYSEPIVLEDFSPKNVLSGDVITITGDYMNLVKSVTFTGDARAEVTVIDRHKATVVVPSNALSGKIFVSDEPEEGVANIIFSEEEVVVGEPTVKKIQAPRWKAGQTVTVSGEHVDMIEKVTLEGATVVDFELAADNKSFTFELPARVASGEVAAVSYAGKEYGKTTIETVLPTGLAAAPQPVKAGETLTITGSDLDLVVSVDYDGAAGAGFSYANGKIESVVPATAKEGDVTLNLANGTSVTTAFTLLLPTIASLSPLELYAGDEDLIVVNGTDLDLVVNATLGGKDVEIVEQSAESISLKTFTSSVSGQVELQLANGTRVTSTETVSLNYHALVVVNQINAAQHIGQEVVILGENLNLVETIYIGETKVTSYGLRADNEIRFLVPWCKVGSYTLSFHLYNGDVEAQPTLFEVLLEQTITTVWEGEDTIGGWDHGFDALSWGKYDFSWVKPGSVLTVYYTPYVGDYDSQMRIGNGSWAALPTTLETFGGDGNIPLSQDSSYYSFVLSNLDVEQLVSGGGIVICGAWFTVNKVVITQDIPQEKTIWEGETYISWSGMSELSWGGYDWSSVEVGSVLTAYFTLDSAFDYWQVRFANGSWVALPSTAGLATDGNIPMEAGMDHYKVTLTEENLNALVNEGGLVMTGTNYTLTKLTLL